MFFFLLILLFIRSNKYNNELNEIIMKEWFICSLNTSTK